MQKSWVTEDQFLSTDIWSLVHSKKMVKASILNGGKRLLWARTFTRDIETHCRQGNYEFPDLMVYKLQDVTLKGMDVVHFNNVPHFFENVAPRYIHDIFPDTNPAYTGEEANEIIYADVPVVSILHWTAGVYGHFLLEMLPKILAFKTLKYLIPTAKLLVSDSTGAMGNILRHFLREEEIITYKSRTQQVKAAELFLIDSMLSKSALHPQMDSFVSLAKAVAAPKSTPRKVYLSKKRWREKKNDFRKLENESVISEFLNSQGFVTVYPETLPWLEQVSLFSGAELIIGEFTSALHNAIFSLPNTSVLAFNYVNEVQDCIASYGKHRIGYILPKDGKKREWKQGIQKENQSYEIDINSLKDALKCIS